MIICSIENFDPMGVHTGDSITVAPTQTLTDVEYQKMRDMAIAVIRKVGVETGGSNIQFAVSPETGEIRIIEMNPRVSRSSALASKATGFTIAKIAAKLAVGYTLDEIPNDITKKTPASFEPTIDYVVAKIPKWDFEKFREAEDVLGTQMKSVGEVMAIGRTFKEALFKGLRSLEAVKPLRLEDVSDDELQRKLRGRSRRFSYITSACNRLSIARYIVYRASIRFLDQAAGDGIRKASRVRCWRDTVENVRQSKRQLVRSRLANYQPFADESARLSPELALVPVYKRGIPAVLSFEALRPTCIRPTKQDESALQASHDHDLGSGRTDREGIEFDTVLSCVIRAEQAASDHPWQFETGNSFHRFDLGSLYASRSPRRRTYRRRAGGCDRAVWRATT